MYALFSFWRVPTLLSIAVLILSIHLEDVNASSLEFPRKFMHITGLGKFRKKEFDVFSPPQNIWQKGAKGYIPRMGNNMTAEAMKRSFRLPKDVVPFHYILELIPILNNGSKLGEQWTAPGNIKILVDCVQSTDSITLHSFLIKYPDSEAIKIKDLTTGENVDVTNHAYSKEYQDFYIIKLGKALEAGHKYAIDIKFVAPVSLGRKDGLYRTMYTDFKTGEKKFIVSTQFEPYSARQAFPCFDEPALKATFDISLIRKEEYISLSNGNLVSSVGLATSEKGWKIDTFNTTVKMSTYTVAFVVADYGFTEAEPSLFPNRPVRIYAPKTVLDKGGGKFAAEVSAKVLNFFEQYFDVPYPMQKMDSIAVPGFPYGAMENYGANIYRDRFLIDLGHNITTESTRGTISSILAHELAHQWFGNLVTCSYWDGIWLNEGFATYYSYIGQNFTNPEYEPMKKLLVDANQFAFKLDSRERSSYPIQLTSQHPDELAKKFFGIPYYKGASLIRMMDGFLSEKTLRAGISRYLKKWAFKSTTQKDVFEALQEQAVEDGVDLNNRTVSEIMDGWTKQRGFPVLRVVTRDENSIHLIQVQNYVKKESKNFNKLPQNELLSWHVPIAIASEADPDFSNHKPKVWIPAETAIVNYNISTKNWLVVNPDSTGYYRVWYDDNIFALLLKKLNEDHKQISVLSRSQILDDYFNFANEGELQVTKPLELTTYFANETEDIVWHVLLGNLRRLHYFFRENSTKNGLEVLPRFKGFRDYMLPRLEGALTKIGVQQLMSDSGVIVPFRAKLLSWACRLGSKLCLDYADELFQEWMRTGINPVPVDLQDFMYCYGVRAGGGRNWLFAVDQYVKASNLLQSLRLAKSLTCGDDADVLNIFMDSVIENETKGVSTEEFLMLFESLSSNPSHRHLAIEFLRTRLPTISKFLKGKTTNILFGVVTDYLYTSEEAEQLRQAHAENMAYLTSQKDEIDIEDHISDIMENMKWMKSTYQPMREWFEAQTNNTMTSTDQRTL